MRICSLLPGGTEILFALGLEEAIVGVSHECDYPPPAARKPKIVRTDIDQDRLSSEAIDQAVQAAVQSGAILYQVNEEILRAADPDLLVTQELCRVCAIETTQVHRLLGVLPRRPEVIALHAHTIAEVLEEIRTIGAATGRARAAKEVVAALTERLERVRTLVAGRPRPRVFCLEWLKPPMACGHWVPEQVACAGGDEVLGRTGAPSRYVTWEEITAARPDVLLLMPCGFSIERTRRELSAVTGQPQWQALPAVRNRRGYLMNGPAYFNRPGPRLVDGVELLAGLLHPERCDPSTLPPLAELLRVVPSKRSASRDDGLMPCGAVEPL